MIDKMDKTNEILSETFSRFSRVGLCWSTGKDSTVCLYLARLFNYKVTVLFGDTTVHFLETYKFRDKYAKDWNLNVYTMKPSVTYSSVKGERERCCHSLKTMPLLETVKCLNLEALIVGVRWDEHESRSEESFFSNRINHVRVHPILHWTEKDIWDYIFKKNIPFNPLYKKGFRSIGCKPCTGSSMFSERSGRSQDKEEVMDKLRKLGYF